MGKLLWLGRANANVLGGRTCQNHKCKAVTKGGSPQAWSNLREDPGWKACAKSDWATKTNEMSVGKQMPLLSEFTGYSEWGNEAKIWTMMLYNRPISLAIDCFIINLKDSGDSADKEASGHSKHTN